MFLATDSFSMPTNPLQSYHSAGLGVFVCDCHWSASPLFSMTRASQGTAMVHPLALAGGWLMRSCGSPAFNPCSQPGLCLSQANPPSILPIPHPALSPSDFNYTSFVEFTGGFPWEEAVTSPQALAAHFLSGLAGPRWNRSLCLLHSLHNLVLEVDLSPLEIQRIKAAFKSRSGY